MPRAVRVLGSSFPSLGLVAGSKIVRTVEKIHDVVCAFEDEEAGLSRRTFVLIVGMYANHQRRMMVEGEQARDQMSQRGGARGASGGR
jgi:hypothetical protein